MLKRLRIDSIRAAAAANSGHPTSSMSAADLMAVLMARHLRYDYDAPENPNNDHLHLLQGPRIAARLRDSSCRCAGAISLDEELLTFRRFGSKLEGHPTPILPWVDVATGSLGQGMPIAAGVALCARDLDRLPYRGFTLCGDSEMAEGSIWEAVEHAGVNGLDNFVAIIDVNRLGQRGETMHGWNLESYAKRAEAAGWNAIEIDGHDIAEIDRASLRGRGDGRQADHDRLLFAPSRATAPPRPPTSRASTASRSRIQTRRSRSSATSAPYTSTWPSPREHRHSAHV